MQRKQLYKNAMNFGGLAGIAMVIVSILIYMLGLQTQKNITGFVPDIILIIFIIYGSLHLRNKVLNGFISYGNALLSGLMIGFFASVILGFYMYVLFKFIDTTLIEQMLAQVEQNLNETNPEMSEDKVEMAMMMTRKFTTPGFIFISAVFNTTLFSILASLVISIFIKKSDDSFGAVFNKSDNSNQ